MIAAMSGILRAELSADAVRHNVSEVRRAIGPGVELCAVVKANAYGHGLAEMLSCLDPWVDRLAVTLPPTALRVRELGWSGPVLTFFRAAGFAHPDAVAGKLADLARADVTVTVVGEDDLELLESVARTLGRPVEAHLKVDTGMSRSGVLALDAPSFVVALRRSPAVRLTGIYTQLASADSSDLESARAQLALFDETLAAVGETEGLTIHAANSAATVALPESHYSMVRPGAALYGFYPSPDMVRSMTLRPVLRLTAQLLEVKTVAAGSRTGYGLTHGFARESRIGLISVGYADGYPRALSGHATMRLRGHDVPVCGRVSMDQVVVDLTEHPTAEVGDEVEVISEDPGSPHGVERLAAQAGTIPYEIVCGLGPRVERRVLEG
jgi:alanine racemase